MEHDCYVLGLDAGGTKTVCLLADGDGRALAEARGPGGNLNAAGEAGVETVFRAVIGEVLSGRAIVPTAICVGIAGVDRVSDASIVKGIVQRIHPRARILVVNDAVLALVAGAGGPSGIVSIAGTGSITYGCNAKGEAARAGGWGHVMADEGSGYWMGRRALAAVMREADRRGIPTTLTAHVLQHFGLTYPQELVSIVYHQDTRPHTIASLASSVQRASDEGDAVATDILREGADQLVLAARAVVTRLGMEGDTFVFVLAGGVFKAVPWLAEELRTRLPILAPRATVNRLAIEPAVGAVRLALAESRGGAVIPAYLEAP